jgi:hypothetical protein
MDDAWMMAEEQGRKHLQREHEQRAKGRRGNE